MIECTDPSASLYTGEIPSDYTHGTVTSYKQKHDGSDKTAVEWEVEGYYTDADCTPANKLDSKPYWMPGYDGSTGQDEAGPGSTTFENVGITYAHAHVTDSMETISTEAAQKNALIANHAVMGSAASPYNLSNPGNNGAAGHIQESANSYIVNGCGWYQIPLVMGNGVKNNALNPDETTYKGYNGTGDDKRVLFKDYKGNNVQNPYLHSSSSGVGTPTSAEIVWEDIEGLIESQKDANGHNTYELPSGCISQSNGVYWLKFRVPTVREGQWIHKDNWGSTGTTLRNEPRQGNAVIAVKDASGTTMWSYHIWVTDYVPRNYSGAPATGVNADIDLTGYLEIDAKYPGFTWTTITHLEWRPEYRVMNRPLGFVTYGTTVEREYAANTVWVRLVQPESGLTTVMEVNQNNGQTELELYRSQPFYNAMRKDAFWPGHGVNGSGVEPKWYGKVPSVLKDDGETWNASSGVLSLEYTIKNPGIIWHKGTSGRGLFITQNIDANQPTNLWNSEETTTSLSLYEESHTTSNEGSTSNEMLRFLPQGQRQIILGKKTIYDPSPAGYIIPPYMAAANGVKNIINNSNTQEQSGIYGFQGLHSFDGETLTIYTDSLHTGTFTMPATGIRANISPGRYITPDRMPNVYACNSHWKGVDDYIMPIQFYHLSASDPTKFGFTTMIGGATAVLPYDDSVGPNPADYPTEWTPVPGTGGSPGSPAPSASSALGRYTVMQVNPEFF